VLRRERRVRLTPLEPWIAGKIGAHGPRPLDRRLLEAWQLERLNETLSLVRSRSRFHRRHLAAAPTVLAELAEVARLPTTTDDDLRADPASLVCVGQDEVSRIVTLDTSGTSGAPKRVFFTAADQALTVDFFRAGMSVFTGPGDRVLILLPGTTPGSVGDLLASALRELGAVPIPHGPVRDAAEAIRVAAAEAATVAVGIPVQLLRMARTPTDLPRPQVHSVLLSTDHVPRAIAAALETAWGCRVYNHFGMTETGLGGGVDCAARRGLHLREADLLFEVIERDGDAPVREGDEGELTVTTLTRQAMPFLRYRTGDLARWLPGPCPCGTTLRTLAYVTTRVRGRHPLPGGGVLTQARLDEALFPVPGVVAFQAVLDLRAPLPSLDIAVEAVGGIDADRVAGEIRAALVADGLGRLRITVTCLHDRLPPGGLSKRGIDLVG
jgi:phenylacetate-coenzyme A ligase PaaK-like adenylate-forming protein